MGLSRRGTEFRIARRATRVLPAHTRETDPRPNVMILATAQYPCDQGTVGDKIMVVNDGPLRTRIARACLPQTGMTGSAASTTAYEVSLSQASSVAQTAKCSVVKNPIRQSAPSKKSRLKAPGEDASVALRQ